MILTMFMANKNILGIIFVAIECLMQMMTTCKPHDIQDLTTCKIVREKRSYQSNTLS